DRARRGQRTSCLAREPGFDPLRNEHAVDPAIARAPRVAKHLIAAGLVEERELVPEPVDRRPERPTPVLRPLGGPARAAAAARPPALDAMHAAPRRPLDDLDLVCRR